jgi:hypothetical protein
MGVTIRGRVSLPAAAIALAISACEAEDDKSDRSASDPGPVHVHGLGINPADGALFIATHTGLFRVPQGLEQAERVAGRYQDTMGFTVVGPDRFLGSGHPDGRENLPPFLGLIESRDAGKTWKPISLQGQRDFHVLEAAGTRVYGFGADFETRDQALLVSSDGGRQWFTRKPPEPLLDLAIDPGAPDRVVASGERRLYGSADGGVKWRPLGDEPGLLAWATSDKLYLVGLDGRTRVSSTGGEGWETMGLIDGEPAALAHHGQDLYVALHDGTVKRSSDGGRQWSVRSRP